MRKWIAGSAVVVLGLCLCAPALADVSVTARQQILAASQANQAKRAAKQARQHAGHARAGRAALATGSMALIDGSGLKYFINTNITFSTSSSASGAASEASYTHAVAASTALGGTTSETLNDAFDGYEAMCVNIGGAQAMPCATGNPGWTIYNKNGAATVDPTCGGRQVVFPTQTIGGLQVYRKVYVPPTDSFARWLNVFTNPTASPITIKMGTSNNLGSDNNTIIVTSNDGTPVVNNQTTWVTTFQNYSGNTTTDPRLGHVLQGPGAPLGLTDIFFANGSDRPYWSYVFTIPAGGTKVIMNFVTGQPSKAAAATKAAELATSPLPAVALACLSTTEEAAVVNFITTPTAVPALSRAALAALVLALAIGAALVLRKSPV